MRATVVHYSIARVLAGSLLAGGLLATVGCEDGSPQVDARPAATNQEHAPIEHFAVGKSLYQDGDFDGAVKEFTAALATARQTDLRRADSAEAQLYFRRGEAYLKMGFPDTAAEDFTHVIRLVPKDGQAYDRRAKAFYRLHDHYKALRDATQAIRLTPRSASAYHTRGLVYLERGQFERAAADLEQAVEQDRTLASEVEPRLGEAYWGWSEQLAEAGDPAGAAEKLATARMLNAVVETPAVVATVETPAEPLVVTVAKPVLPDEARAHFEQGLQRQKEQRHDAALMEFTKAIAIEDDYADAFLQRGVTLMAMGFPDSALKDFTEAIRTGGPSARAKRLEARAFLALNRPYRASESATDSLHFDPSSAEAYAIRGEAYLRMDAWDRAIVDLEEAVRRDAKLAEQLQPLLAEARAGLSEQEQRESVDAAGDDVALSTR